MFNIKIKLDEFILALYCFAGNYTKEHMEFVGIKWSSRTYADWCSYFRQICTFEYKGFTKMMRGPIVCIDESAFRKNPCSGNKSQRNHSAAHYLLPKWVFGIYSVKERIFRMKFVQDRSKKSLLPLIVEWVEEGTEIWSDKWKSYTTIKEGIDMVEEMVDYDHESKDDMELEKDNEKRYITYYYKHRTVNHSDKGNPFIQDGVCTNSIKRMWGRVKSVLKRHQGIPSHLLQSHLDEFLFRWNCTNGTTNDVFEKLLKGVEKHWPAEW